MKCLYIVNVQFININSHYELVNIKALNQGIIPLFAPRCRACEVSEEVVELYAEVHDQLSIKMEKTLYSVLYAMVDVYFLIEDDYGRVMKMLNALTIHETKNEFQSLKIAKNRNKLLEDAIKEVCDQNAKLNARIANLEARIERLKYQYNGK